MVMRVRWKKLGGHYHCRVFTARMPNQTYAKVGELVFDETEFTDAQRIMSGAEFVDDEKAYTCPHCGRVSYNPTDKRESYCGACHRFATT